MSPSHKKERGVDDQKDTTPEEYMAQRAPVVSFLVDAVSVFDHFLSFAVTPSKNSVKYPVAHAS